MPDLPATTPTSTSPSTPLAQVGDGDGGHSGMVPETGGSQSKRVGLGLLFVLVVAGLAVLIVFFAFMRHWAAVHTGTLNESGPYYGFWSGFGSDLGEATLITAVPLTRTWGRPDPEPVIRDKGRCVSCSDIWTTRG